MRRTIAKSHTARRTRPASFDSSQHVIASAPHLCQRRGIVLPMVLVVIVVVTLGAYSFTETSLVEKQATALFAREVQARAFAYSGIEFATATLTQRLPVGEENLYHNPALFQKVLLDSPIPRGRGRFSIVAPLEHDPNSPHVRFGLQNESGKLNVNAIVNFTLEPDQMRLMLTGGPEELIMTAAQADVILDFVDAENPGETREFGREDDFSKNGELVSLDELLVLPEVTRFDLYGEDVNRNGRLDFGEDIDGDGALRLGWHAFLTVDAIENNLRADGTPRINVNQSLLTELYDALIEEFTEEEAQFIVAYRAYGPVQTDEEAAMAAVGTGQTNSTSESTSSLLNSVASAIAKSGVMGGGVEGAVTRAGLDLSGGGKHKLTSLYDLVGAQVEAQVDGVQKTLESPWAADPSSMQATMPILMDALSLTDDTTIPGRINLNEARYEVLCGLPGMTPSLADYISKNRPVDSAGNPIPDQIARHSTTAWLFMDGQIELPELRLLDPYVTARGDVFRSQVVGHFDAGGPVVRVEAVIDASVQPPQVVRVEDLTDLGRGYALSQLVGR